MKYDQLKTLYFAKMIAVTDENHQRKPHYLPPLIEAHVIMVPLDDSVSYGIYGSAVHKTRRLFDDVGQLESVTEHFGVWEQKPVSSPYAHIGSESVEYLAPDYTVITPVTQYGNYRKCDIRRCEHD